MNVVMTGAGRFVEVQGTAEGLPFTRAELDELLALAEHGIGEIFDLQRELLAEPPAPRRRVTTLRPRDRESRQGRGDRAILRDAAAPVDLLRPRRAIPEVEETGATLEENARLKAVALCAATGLPAIADDTGLEVDALGGAPGVYSARFAGARRDLRRQRDPLLLRRLAGVPRSDGPRGSRPSPSRAGPTVARSPRSARSRARSPKRPEDERASATTRVFVPDEGDGRTFAEMTAAEKHAISHRGRAFRTLADGLRVLAEVGDC